MPQLLPTHASRRASLFLACLGVAFAAALTAACGSSVIPDDASSDDAELRRRGGSTPSPDAGTPSTDPCPLLSPPAPGLCPGGTLQPNVSPSGCVTGYTCLPPPPPPPPNACVDLGGSCVGISPSSCPSGRWGEAGSCGSGIGVGCCLPSCPMPTPLPPGFCPGGTIQTKLDASGCWAGYVCLPPPPPPPPSSCAAAGGTCVGIAPGACPSGNVAGALSCGGGIGVTCCLP